PSIRRAGARSVFSIQEGTIGETISSGAMTFFLLSDGHQLAEPPCGHFGSTGLVSLISARYCARPEITRRGGSRGNEAGRSSKTGIEDFIPRNGAGFFSNDLGLKVC